MAARKSAREFRAFMQALEGPTKALPRGPRRRRQRAEDIARTCAAWRRVETFYKRAMATRTDGEERAERVLVLARAMRDRVLAADNPFALAELVAHAATTEQRDAAELVLAAAQEALGGAMEAA